jgi:GNAT superfamily N-acetyltransferase
MTRDDAGRRAAVAAAVEIVALEAWHAPHLERLQVECFPDLAAHELMRAEHFLRHLEVFPEGDVVAVARRDPDGRELQAPRVVGLGAGFFTDFDLEHPHHTFKEVIAGGTFANHDPDGAWYYGADLSVHPAYRGLGLGRRLYDARKAICVHHGRLGIVAGGALPGFAAHKRAMSAASYVAKVVAGELFDPTLTMQLRNGFEVVGLLEGYLDDAAADGWATLIVWRTPAGGAAAGVSLAAKTT